MSNTPSPENSLPLAGQHLPSAISPWWPLAPGWWVLIAIVIGLIVLSISLWRRHRRRNHYRSLATEALNSLKNGTDDAELARDCNEILKRTVVTAYGKQLGSTSGTRWTQFLVDSADLNSDEESSLQQLEAQRYRPNCSLDRAVIIATCQRYIKKHKRHYIAAEGSQHA